MEQYHILERIGEGAHGVVLKAKHLQVYRNVKYHQMNYVWATDWGTSGTEENPTQETGRWYSKFGFEVCFFN